MALAPHIDEASPERLGLIERGGALDALSRHLAEAEAGAGRMLIIRGEAGIGKTSLVRAFRSALPDELLVAAGATDGVSTPRPYGALYDMAPALGGGLDKLLAEEANGAEVSSWLLDALTRSGARMLLIEDLQWADDATLEMLAFLARRIEQLGVLAVATVRDDEDLPLAVQRALGMLATIGAVHQLVLAPLTADGVAMLASGSRVDPGELHRLTSGNPFFVTEVLASSEYSIPVSVRDLIRAKVRQLTTQARAALETAAILGNRIEPWLLAAVAGEAVLGTDDCLAAGLLVKEGGIAFRHELTRMTVLEDLPVFRGIAIHRRALDALHRSGSRDDGRLAYHAEGAADGEAVFQYAAAAGKHALAMGAHHEAEAQFRRALRFDHGAAAVDRADLLESLSRTLFLINELDGAYDARRDALALRRTEGERLRIGDDLRTLGFLASLVGRSSEGWRLCQEALDVLEPMGESRELARAYATLGRMGVTAQRSRETRQWSQRALDIAPAVGDQETVVVAMTNIGTIAWLEGDMATGKPLLLQALALARAADLPEQVDRALNNLGVCSVESRELAAALEYFNELEEFTIRTELERCSIWAYRANVAFELGQWDLAGQQADAALDAPRTDRLDRCDALVVKAKLHLRRGSGSPDELLREVESLAPDQPYLIIEWPLTSARAEAAWLAGSLPAIVPDLHRVYDLACEAQSPWAIGELARWLQRAGVERGIHPTTPRPYRLLLEKRFREAAAAFDELSMPYEAAGALADSSDPDDLRDAHARLTKLGAAATAEQVVRRIRNFGGSAPRGARASTRHHPAGLTAREAEIAELAAEGLSNREIAERLVLTEKTVSHHVSAVLGKLGVRRRAEIHPRLARLQAESGPAVTAL